MIRFWKVTYLVAVFAVATHVIPAQAQTVRQLGDELQALLAEAPALNRVMEQTTEENMRLYKEYKLYADDQKQKDTMLQEDMQNQRDTLLAPLEQTYKSHLDAYKAQCDPTMVGKVTPGQFQQCEQWKEKLDREKADVLAQWQQYSEDYERRVLAPIYAARYKQTVRMDEIDGLMKANFKTFTDKQDRFLAIRTRVRELQEELDRLCPAPGEGSQAARQRDRSCTGIDWEGAARRLPPMYTYPGTGASLPVALPATH